MMDEHGRVIGPDGLPIVWEKRAEPAEAPGGAAAREVRALAATVAGAEALHVLLYGAPAEESDGAADKTPEVMEHAEGGSPEPEVSSQPAEPADKNQELGLADDVLDVTPSSMAPRPENRESPAASDVLTDQERNLLDSLSSPLERADLDAERGTDSEHPEDFATREKTSLNKEENPAIPTDVQTHTEANMPINFHAPDGPGAQLKPRITVVGVGGAGGNAVNNMITSGLEGVDFVVANTDAQALAHARTDRRIQLGQDVTQGLGAGARPDVGMAAAEETYETIAKEMEGSNMVFITAGMGGGTGTGAAPVISRIARDMGILTVGVVTKPFQFEGVHRMRLAEQGIEELAQYVDTLIIIPNQNLFRVANERTTFADAFKMADDVLNSGVRSVTDLMVMPGLINLDFADVRTVMSGMGRAMMGTGEADGESRAIQAAEAAIANPLLEDTCMKGAGGVLINITGGPDITLFEVDEAANRIKDEVESPDAHIIFGSCFDEGMEGKMRVSVVATGIAAEAVMAHPRSTGMSAGGMGAPRPAPLSVSSPSAAEKPAQPQRQQPAATEEDAEPMTARLQRAAEALDVGREREAAPAGQHQPQPVEARAEHQHQQEHRATGTDGAPAPTGFSQPRFPQPRESFIPRPPVSPNGGHDTGRPSEPAPESRGYQAQPQPHSREAAPAPQQRPQPQQPAAPRAVSPAPRPQPLASPQRPATGGGSGQSEEPRGLAGGLLARMTGLARRHAAPQAQEPEVRTSAPQARRTEPQREEPAARDQQHQPAQQPEGNRARDDQYRLAVDPDDRVQTSSQEDDELEIPAFLRRQAN
ncbi:Cell division protein FtsZ [Caenispirillum salinarum AK4]|uniref:Cell division protein FtsZ n=2 Tax=Caenispirillum TaxID=414051 RepID=K9HHS5_9PROT|nr:Cell division protein FtsZ [Caenispirillum salinarum AK4]